MIRVFVLLTVCSGENPLRPETDIHAVCDLVKSWFRVLPEPVFPPSSYYDIMQKMRKFLALLLANRFIDWCRRQSWTVWRTDLLPLGLLSRSSLKLTSTYCAEYPNT